ncbi:uncharacterized protein DS421_6g189410 [Arachis hypogaea]|nr:uncharacterized protein DS421_6g189410 [Arachis hypogaea]
MEVHVAHLLSATKKVEGQDEEASVSSKVLMKNEVEEAFDPELLHSQEPLEVTMKHKDSLPEALMENHEEEREEDTQEKSNSSEAENHMKEGVIEPSLQGTLDEDKTPTITQPPRLGLKEVKAIDKNTKKRIVTKISRTTFKKRSTANNPPLIKQASSIKPISKESLLRGNQERDNSWNFSSLEVIPLNQLEEEEESEEQHVKLMTLKEHLLGGNPTVEVKARLKCKSTPSKLKALSIND